MIPIASACQFSRKGLVSQQSPFGKLLLFRFAELWAIACNEPWSRGRNRSRSIPFNSSQRMIGCYLMFPLEPQQCIPHQAYYRRLHHFFTVRLWNWKYHSACKIYPSRFTPSKLGRSSFFVFQLFFSAAFWLARNCMVFSNSGFMSDIKLGVLFCGWWVFLRLRVWVIL